MVWFGARRSTDDPERLCLVVDHDLELSRLLPVLESLGLWVTDEARWAAGDLFVHHLGVRVARRRRRPTRGPPAEAETAARLGAAVAALVDRAAAEADGLNRLVTRTPASGWDDVAVLRAYRRYRHQVDARWTTRPTSTTCWSATPRWRAALVELFARPLRAGTRRGARGRRGRGGLGSRVRPACDRPDPARPRPHPAGPGRHRRRHPAHQPRPSGPTGPLALKLDPRPRPRRPRPRCRTARSSCIGPDGRGRPPAGRAGRPGRAALQRPRPRTTAPRSSTSCGPRCSRTR